MALQKLRAFGRRKSTGNALDEPMLDLPEPDSQESSFKVIPRNSRQNVISFDTPVMSDNRYSHASSAQTRPGQDTAASSLRYSSTSTNPSSVEFDDRNSFKNPSLMPHGARGSSDILPRNTRLNLQPPRIDSLNEGKPLPPDPFSLSSNRDRALTTSSYASTAVPPKLEQPLPTLGDNSFDDLESMFAGLGERKSGPKVNDALPQPPQRTFQRADSEPLLTPRKPVGSTSPNLGSTPTVLRVTRTPLLDSAEPSPDLNRKSTDRLLSQNSSAPGSPGSPAVLPTQSSKTNGVTLHSGLSSRQTLDSTSGDEGKKSRVVSFDASAIDKQPGNALQPSSRGSDSSQSFNAAALAYAAEDSEPGVRRMTQRDFNAMKERENYEDKLRLRRGESIDDEGPTIYEDLDDDEDDRRREKRKREKQQADLAVNRQQMRKLIGRESSDPALNTRRISSIQTTVSSEPEDPHLLPYAHNLPPVTPQDPKRLTVDGSNNSANLPKVGSRTSLNRSSGDEDDDVPLGILQPHLMQKNADVNRRVSSAGSLLNGSASITPGPPLAASPNRLSAWPNQPDNRPKSRASNASHLPAFAQRLPAPEQLPFIPGFQGTPPPGGPMNGMGGYFGPQPMGSGASVYGGMTPPVPGPIVYQDGFTGAYHAQGPQSNTFMDTIQAEERRKKTKYKSTPQQGFQRSSTMPNMQGFHPQHASMPPMQMMDPLMQQQMAMMQQMQMLQQQMAIMSGMNPNMLGLGMDPHQMQQMQVQMQQMNMNGSVNNQRRTSTQSQFGNGPRPNTGFLGSLPAIPDASPTRSSVLPVPNGAFPPGYAPSIAPSERSNVGMPSRYKPVSMMNDNASILGDVGRPQDMSSAVGAPSTVGGNSIRATLRPMAVGPPQASDDDADNEGSGWGAMRARRSRNKQSLIV